MASRNAAVTAYRSLYRQGLRAIHFSKPARFVLREILRNAFRNEPSSNLDLTKVANTLRFLELATHERAMEHKILKNILHTRFWVFQRKPEGSVIVQGNSPSAAHIRLNSMKQFDSTIEMLNRTLGLCLR